MKRAAPAALRVAALRVAIVAALAASVAAATVARRGGPVAPQRQEATPAAAQSDVLLITLDTTRRDYLGCYGKTPSPTPALDALAAKSVVFDGAHTVAPLTLPAHATLLTGLYPASHGLHDNSLYRLPDAARTLAERLHDDGFATGAAVAAFVLDPVFGLAQGFDGYSCPPRGVSTNRSLHFSELPASAMVDRALADLARLGRAGPRPPWFYWLHLYDAHAPYAPKQKPEVTPAVAVQRDAVLRALYEAELREMDAEIGRLLAELSKRGALERATIVVTADHGEALGDGGEETHGQFLRDSTMRIPLLWREPGLAPGRVAAPVSLADVAPTLLARVAAKAAVGGDEGDAGGGEFDGIDLSPWLAERALAAPDRVLPLESWYLWLNFGFAPFEGVAAGPLKYVRSAREELYDRDADPQEQQNLFAPGEPRAAQLRRRLDALQEQANALARAAPALSEADRAALAALGYAQGGSNAGRPDGDWSTLPDGHAKRDVLAAFDALSGLIDRADWDGALALLREWTAREPGVVLFHEQLGMLLINVDARNAAEAVTELERTLQLDPRRGRVWFALARAHEALGDDARRRKEDARERGRGREAKRAGEEEHERMAKAQQAARECLRLEPNYPDALTWLGRLLALEAERAYAIDDRAAARSLYTEVVDLIDRFFASVGPDGAADPGATAMRERAKARLATLPR